MKRVFILFSAGVIVFMKTLSAAPEVTDVVAKQRYPWNGLVDVTCKVSGIDGMANGFKFAVALVDPDSGDARSVSSFWVVQNGTNSVDCSVRANGDYRLLWDARGSLGEVRCSNMVVRVTLMPYNDMTHGKVKLWEGGPYWATTNVGAEKPEDCGYYFWWGDTVGYTNTGSAWVSIKDGTSISFSSPGTAASTRGKSIATLQGEGWITADGALAPEHDAAQVQWGGGWRMPTVQEISVLVDTNICDWTWTTNNGVKGHVVCGRGDYASASIFLPAASYVDGKNLAFDGVRGYYWSSAPSYVDDRKASILLCTLDNHNQNAGYRHYGLTIRPVQGELVEMDVCADSTPFPLDTRTGVRESMGEEALAYSSWWNGGANATVTIAQDGVALVEGVAGEGDWAWSVQKAGTYTLTHVTLTNGAASKVEAATFKVTKDIASLSVGDFADVTYTGSPFTPDLVVTDAACGYTLVQGTDYTLSYANNVNAGTATVTVTGMGCYTGTFSNDFTIAKQIVTPPTIPAKFYTGDPQTADVPASEKYHVVQNTPQVNPDNYPVELELSDGANYCWPGTESAFYTVFFTIESGGEEPVVEPGRIQIPGSGTMTTPKSWKAGQKVTWKAKADKGSVFAHWEGDIVDSLGLSRNELRNPSIQFTAPAGLIDTNGIRAVFIALDSDRLGMLALSSGTALAPDAAVAGLELLDDSESYVTASASGLPTGLKFDAKTLSFTGKPTKPGVYAVKVTAKNASGYQWAETLEMRVSDREDPRIDFSDLPTEIAVGDAYAGKVAAGEFKTLSASGLPTGLKFNAKTGAVAGIPTKGGYFTVTVTASYADKTKATATRLMTVTPTSAPVPKRTEYHPLTTLSANLEMGTVTGTGVYAAGKKVSISAKAAKGYVFAGWYRDAALEQPMVFASGDWRKASQSVVVPEVRYLFARFVPMTTVADPVTDLTYEGQSVWYVGVALPGTDAVTFGSASLPTVSASGLPAGVKFDAAARRFTGVPTKAGTYLPTVTVKNASKSSDVLRQTIVVKALPVWAQGTFNGAAFGGADATGLVPPAGMVTLAVAANGKVSGKLLKGGKTWTLAAASYGSYDAETDAYTATVVGKSGKEAFTNEMTVAAEPVRIAEDGAPRLRGVVSGATAGRAVPGEPLLWTAWQNLWKAEPWKTAAKAFAKAKAPTLHVVDDAELGRVVLDAPAAATDAALPVGTITLKFASSGAVTASGKFVAGKNAKGQDVFHSASCTSVLVPILPEWTDDAGQAAADAAYQPPTANYRLYLYFPPKAGKFDDGLSVEIPLAWDGTAFALRD